MYGTGIQTEVGYHFKDGRIDRSVNDDSGIKQGIILGEGDGSVPQESLQHLCKEGWAPGSIRNPRRTKIYIKEIAHNNETEDAVMRIMRGYSGKVESSDHVDILGHHTVLADVFALAAGRPDLVGN